MSDPISPPPHGEPGPQPESEPRYLLSEDGFPLFVADPGHWSRPLSLTRGERERLRRAWDHLSRTVEEAYDCESRLRAAVSLDQPLSAAAEPGRGAGAPAGSPQGGPPAIVIDEEGLAWPVRPVFVEWEDPTDSSLADDPAEDGGASPLDVTLTGARGDVG